MAFPRDHYLGYPHPDEEKTFVVRYKFSFAAIMIAGVVGAVVGYFGFRSVPGISPPCPDLNQLPFKPHAFDDNSVSTLINQGLEIRFPETYGELCPYAKPHLSNSTLSYFFLQDANSNRWLNIFPIYSQDEEDARVTIATQLKEGRLEYDNGACAVDHWQDHSTPYAVMYCVYKKHIDTQDKNVLKLNQYICHEPMVIVSDVSLENIEINPIVNRRQRKLQYTPKLFRHEPAQDDSITDEQMAESVFAKRMHAKIK